VGAADTRFLGQPLAQWLARRKLTLAQARLSADTDLQEAALFPLLARDKLDAGFIRWMTAASPAVTGTDIGHQASLWLQSPRLSAQELGTRGNPRRLYAQRAALRRETIPTLFRNRRKSVFFSLDLAHLSGDLAVAGGALDPLDDAGAGPLARAKDHMFAGHDHAPPRAGGWESEEGRAFSSCAQSIVGSAEAAKVDRA
jgi:hypothetical protein